MFLALKEIKHEKLRYGLITVMIFLVSYLIFILSGLSFGLGAQNTKAVNDWGVKSVVLNKDSNTSLSQSILSKDDVDKANFSKKEALVGMSPVVTKHKNAEKTSAQFMGIRKNEFIYQGLSFEKGKTFKHNQEVVVNESFLNLGYKLGDKIKLNSIDKSFKIVGFVKNAEYNMAPIVYGSVATFKTLKGNTPHLAGSGIFSKTKDYTVKDSHVKTFTIQSLINKMPGYSAQNMTFTMMIAFLLVISMIVIAVFLYILTIQKLPNYSVLRAQGIQSSVLVKATIGQSLILVVIGLVIAVIVTLITGALLPSSVPVSFDPMILAAGSLGLLLMGLIGSLLPIRTILKVDPSKAIG